jgi:hypothetical protein
MWLGGGETLPPMISADFSTIVAALDRTSKGFSDCSTLFLEGDCTGDVSAATAVPRIIDIPHEKVEKLFKAELAKAILQVLSAARISSSF